MRYRLRLDRGQQVESDSHQRDARFAEEVAWS